MHIADLLHQLRGRAAKRVDRPFDFGEPEAYLGRRRADIARQHQFETAADAVAIDRRDNRLGIGVGLEERMVDHARDLGPRGQIAGDIGADRKGACPRTGQHNGAAASVMFQFGPQPAELGEHHPCHRVEAQLIIDRDDRDMPPVSCEADFHQTGSRSIRPVPYTRRVTKGEPDEGDAVPGMGRARRIAAGGRLTARPAAGRGPHPGARDRGQFRRQLMVGGTYQVKPPFPFTPGLEAAGEVIETGSGVTGLRTGQRVLAVLRNGGGYAEEIVLDAATVVPIPEAMDFVTAAAFPVAYGTAYFALTHRGHLQSGETLLVLGAAGGVGLTAVEIGKALGARVIAAAGGADKIAVAKSRGADELIDYRSESIRDRVRELSAGNGADIVYDPVGGDAFDQALRAVNWEARMLVIGFAGGRIQSVPANLILVRNISVIGVVWGAQAERDPVLISRNLAELLRWWQAGRLKPSVAKVFPLAEAGAAMKALRSRQYAGKIVLET